jgi:hypothetical protein
MILLISLKYFNRKQDESGEIGVTIDIAAQDGKINGNQLRKIIYDEISSHQKIDDQIVILKEFSLTNLEGKLRNLHLKSHYGHHKSLCCFFTFLNFFLQFSPDISDILYVWLLFSSVVFSAINHFPSFSHYEKNPQIK